MRQSDKDFLLKFLVHNFTRMGATEEQALKAINSRTPSMLKWIVSWIGHNTNYLEVKHLTNSILRQGMYAWIHYKAVVEVLGPLKEANDG